MKQKSHTMIKSSNNTYDTRNITINS